MQRLSYETRQEFARKVILPIVGFLVALFLVAIGGLFWIAHYETRVAIERQVELAKGAFQIVAEELGASTADYGSWDDAVAAVIGEPDQLWLEENIGAATEGNLGVSMVFALDPQGRPIYSYVESASGAEDPSAYLGAAFEQAYGNWRQLPVGAIYSGLIAHDNRAVAIGIAPIRYFSMPEIAPTGFSLILLKFIDDAQIAKIGHNFQLDNFRTAAADPGYDASIVVGDSANSDGIRFAWDPQRPGDDLLRVALPFMTISLLLLLVLAGVVFNYVISSAQILRDREVKAYCDPLTGLANRARFFLDLDLAVGNTGRDPSKVAIMYIDLDGFKSVNDTMGHAAGDELLTQAGQRFKACVRDTDVVARLGGDEFAIIVPSRSDREEIAMVAGRILNRIAETFDLAAGHARISCSIGIAINSGASTRTAELLDLADRALYQAKAAGKNVLRITENDRHPAPNLRVA